MPGASFEASPAPVIGVCGGLGVFRALLLFDRCLQLAHVILKTSLEPRCSSSPPTSGPGSCPHLGCQCMFLWVPSATHGCHLPAKHPGADRSCRMGAVGVEARPSVTGRGGRLVGKRERLSRLGRDGEGRGASVLPHEGLCCPRILPHR